jgi:hypothetical protein
MDDEKKADSRKVQGSEEQPAKKPYARPVLRRLGTVRELTHGAKSGHTGK